MISFEFIFIAREYIYIYILYLQSMWQQIKSDIYVKFILIKLYKNGLQ